MRYNDVSIPFTDMKNANGFIIQMNAAIIAAVSEYLRNMRYMNNATTVFAIASIMRAKYSGPSSEWNILNPSENMNAYNG